MPIPHSQTTRILGIDPGYGRCGYGVIEKEGNRYRMLAYGCIETSSKEDFPTRLMTVHRELNAVIKEYTPQMMGVEELFFAKNTTTALKVAQARGVILLSAMQTGLEIREITPNQVKQAITGQGSADKGQMQQMVKILLNLAKIPKPDDAADALAVALAVATWNPMIR